VWAKVNLIWAHTFDVCTNERKKIVGKQITYVMIEEAEGSLVCFGL